MDRGFVLSKSKIIFDLFFLFILKKIPLFYKTVPLIPIPGNFIYFPYLHFPIFSLKLIVIRKPVHFHKPWNYEDFIVRYLHSYYFNSFCTTWLCQFRIHGTPKINWSIDHFKNRRNRELYSSPTTSFSENDWWRSKYYQDPCSGTYSL